MKTKKQIENEYARLIKSLDNLTSSSAFKAEIRLETLAWVLSEKEMTPRVLEGLQDDLFDKKRTVKKYYRS